jgi:hypothetical protein
MRNKNWGILTQQLIKVLSIDTYAFDLFLGEAGGFVVAAGGSEGGLEDQAAVGSDEALTLSAGDGTSGTTFAFSVWQAAGITGQAYSSVTKVEIGADANSLIEQAVTTNYTVNGAGVISIVEVTDGVDAADNGAYIVRVSYLYDIANAGSGAPTGNDAVTDSGYDVVEKKYSFLTINSEAGDGETGQFVVPDRYGNYATAASASRRTDQVVGRLMGVDYRFQKDLLDTVQSKYEADAAFRTAGTGTMGVPQFVYNFAYEALVAGLATTGQTWSAKFGTQAEASVIADACAAGAFGEAWIQLNI